MSDFANASIMGLINHQLRKSNPELLESITPRVDAVRGALVPAEKKRDILDLIWHNAGVQTLLSIGQGIADIGYDPIWHEAVRAESPQVIFEKWRRFEKFGHTRNRLRINHDGNNHASFKRYAMHGDMPTAPENLLICGLIIAILETCGTQELCCNIKLADGSTHLLRKGGKFFVPDNAALLNTTKWAIEWQGFTATWKPTEAQQNSDRGLPGIHFPAGCEQALKSWVLSVTGLMMQDVSRMWKVGMLAKLAGVSTRSLQRRLQNSGLSFSCLLRQVRIHEACRLLKQPDISITTVGYCSGFSDSAHFSRDFRASVGMAPSDYRTTMVAGG